MVSRTSVLSFFAFSLIFNQAQAATVTDSQDNLVSNIQEYIQLPLDEDKKILIEKITISVSAKLTVEELNVLRNQLQDLATKVKVPTLLEIYKKLKTEIVRLGTRALVRKLLNQSKPVSPTTTAALSAHEVTLKNNLTTVLQKITVAQYGEFIRDNAAELSDVIYAALTEKLPEECIPALNETVATISQLDQATEIQEILTAFALQHQQSLAGLF